MNIKKMLYEKKNYTLKEIIDIGKYISLPINIEYYKNSIINRWKNEKIPFDYGSIINHINEADNMEWDVIIPLSSNINDKNLLISGIIKIKPNADELNLKIGNIPGNHKLIISKNGKLTNEDKQSIINYFNDLISFENPIFFNDENYNKFLEEEWSKSLLTKYKLGNFKDKSMGGIAVGNVVRKYFGAPKINNNFPKTY